MYFFSKKIIEIYLPNDLNVLFFGSFNLKNKYHWFVKDSGFIRFSSPSFNFIFFLKIPLEFLFIFFNKKTLFFFSKKPHFISFNLFNSQVKNFFKNFFKPFSFKLFLNGVGFKVSYNKNTHSLLFDIGYSHSIKVLVPKNIQILSNKDASVSCICFSKVDLSLFVVYLQSIRQPEVYKAKGIHTHCPSNLNILKVYKKFNKGKIN